MSFFKHVGIANGKKVIIVQRQLTGDDSHMAAVLYSDILPTRYHDDVMQLLESPEGQAAWEFRDILQRRYMANGENMLQALSQENFIKRVPQTAVLVKPNSKSSVRLDELNKILNDAGRGEQAAKKLDEMDRQLGLNQNPGVKPPTPGEHEEPSVSLDQLGVTVEPATPVAPAVTSPELTSVLAQMMQTMQSMQQQLNEMKPAPRARRTRTKTTPST